MTPPPRGLLTLALVSSLALGCGCSSSIREATEGTTASEEAVDSERTVQELPPPETSPIDICSPWSISRVPTGQAMGLGVRDGRLITVTSAFGGDSSATLLQRGTDGQWTAFQSLIPPNVVVHGVHFDGSALTLLATQSSRLDPLSFSTHVHQWQGTDHSDIVLNAEQRLPSGGFVGDGNGLVYTTPVVGPARVMERDGATWTERANLGECLLRGAARDGDGALHVLAHQDGSVRHWIVNASGATTGGLDARPEIESAALVACRGRVYAAAETEEGIVYWTQANGEWSSERIADSSIVRALALDDSCRPFILDADGVWTRAAANEWRRHDLAPYAEGHSYMLLTAGRISVLFHDRGAQLAEAELCVVER